MMLSFKTPSWLPLNRFVELLHFLRVNVGLFLISVLIIVLASCTSSNMDNVQYVDPFIGTEAAHFVSEWRSEGCTYPGAVAPHGIAQPSPETSKVTDRNKGYYYGQDTIYRFSMAEHFSGWPDGSQGKGIFMPYSTQQEKKVNPNNAASFYQHEKEMAVPGYYEVFLESSGIACSFAALPRSAIGAFHFQQKGDHGLILQGFDSLTYLSETELALRIKAGSQYITKKSTSLFLHIAFSKPFDLYQSADFHQLVFEEDKVHMKYGVSYTSADNARINLKTEIPSWNVDLVAKKSYDLWNDELGVVEIPEGERSDKTRFFTALYHAQLLPVNATDVNREYPGHEIMGALEDDESHFIYFSPWDAFRAKQPLYNLLYPNKSRDFLRSIVRIYQIDGVLPEPEVMTGVHLTSMFADALAKGITDFEVPLAYKGLKEMMLYPPYFRESLSYYDSLGHVPYPHRYATTATLEFAFNDWALAQVATYLGDEEIFKKLEKRSLNYQNHFNPETRLMETKNTDDTWAEASIYAEANAWNASWFVPHDPQGLINLMGGDKFFVEHLERIFLNDRFVLDNECPLNFPFLFSYAGQPWKTMKWKRNTRDYYFNNTPGGIPGNDDWGSISSWLAWSELGFFPSNPGVDELVIAGPSFEKVILNVGNKNQVIIQAKNLTDENIYVQALKIDGEDHNSGFISQKKLVNSKKVIFTMGDKPQKKWGVVNGGFRSLTSGKPSFKLLDLQVNKTSVRSHECIILTASLQNNGETGSFPMVVSVNEQPIDTVFVLLKNGQRKEVEVPLSLYVEGVYDIKVGSRQLEVHVTATRLSVEQSLKYGAPKIAPLTRNTDEIDYRVEVRNVSGTTIRHRPQLRVDSKLINSLEEIEIKPGEVKVLEGSVSVSLEKGFHRLSFDLGPSSIFKVFEQASEALVLYYTFDEELDFVYDHSGFGNHGELVGQVHRVDGVEGNGLKPQKAYVKVPDSPSLTVQNEEITIVCWYQPVEEDGRASLITKGAHHMMKLNNSGQLQLAIGGWGVGQNSYFVPTDVQTGKPLWQGQWSHFVGSRADDELHLYYNGVKREKLKVTGEIGDTPWSWRVGSNAEIPIGRVPDGVIDEVMIFAKSLSEEEVKALYNRFSNKGTTENDG